MTARNDTRANSFRYPRRHNVVTDLGLDTQQIAGAHAEFVRMRGMNPEWVGVCDLVEPFCIRAACVNLHSQTESRDQDRLILFEIVFMNVALEVSWKR